MDLKIIKDAIDEKFMHFDKRLDKLEIYHREVMDKLSDHKANHASVLTKVEHLTDQIKSLPETKKDISTLQTVQNFFVKILYMIIPVMIMLIINAYFIKKGL